jgi:hypothetical protein
MQCCGGFGKSARGLRKPRWRGGWLRSVSAERYGRTYVRYLLREARSEDPTLQECRPEYLADSAEHGYRTLHPNASHAALSKVYEAALNEAKLLCYRARGR